MHTGGADETSLFSRRVERLSVANGDEARYADAGYVASFSKGLPQRSDGTVDPGAFRAFVRAIEQRDTSLLDPRSAQPVYRVLGATLTDDTCVAGCDPFGIALPAAPQLASPQSAYEAVELAWLALTRDVPFARYESDSLIARAAADLRTTPREIFQASFGKTGPYISQFAFADIPHPLYGSLAQRHDFPVAQRDFMTDRAEWLAIRNGNAASARLEREGRLRYIATGRDLADWVFRNGSLFDDAAALIEALPRAARAPRMSTDMRGLMGIATDAAGIGVFHQKFGVHRRLRPEDFFGLIDANSGAVRFDAALEKSPAIDLLRARNGTALLPQTHAGGCPPHPSYPAAHSTFAGAAATILKAFVRPDAVMEKPVVPNADGTALLPYTGPPLLITSELDKLAVNFAYGRHTAGVHYRSDSDAGLRFGEAAALAVLRDAATMCARTFSGFRLTTFDGESLTITGD